MWSALHTFALSTQHSHHLIRCVDAAPRCCARFQSTDLVANLVAVLEHYNANRGASPYFGSKSPSSPTYFAILGSIMASVAGMKLLSDVQGIKHLYAFCDGSTEPRVIQLFLDALDPRSEGHPRVILQVRQRVFIPIMFLVCRWALTRALFCRGPVAHDRLPLSIRLLLCSSRGVV